ncbi:CusA/CzcA family heavy metal efflux RND transporter [Flammeovirgaceae bacterium SG7u.111]|nr:CusA/CzcA family heavy metal efflux RND transporter [Flammeovirgaceae bacterium SG7u.132]WPO38527.1 CusA/CzcA family heavy metal efflux RND transporter [Flammeovirgaceae bacterium SG7u.111]
MIDRIIAFSIKNKLFIGLFTLALIGMGLWSITKVPIDAVPDITNNQVQVITVAPNLGTEDIEQFVTYPVEVAMANLPGLLELRSVSRFGLSVVTIVFEDDMGTYLPRQLVGEKLILVKEDIPQGFGEPFMGPISTGLGEIYQYTLEVLPGYEDAYSAMDLRTFQDWIVSRQMSMVPGVVEVNAFGGELKQYEVTVDPDKLKAIGISITDIFNALKANNQNMGGAYIEKGHMANFIRGEGLARSISDLEEIVVTNEGGMPILVKDVAKVKFGSAVRYGGLTKNGKGEAVGGMILMLKGANSNNVIAEVKERIEQIKLSLPEGVTIEPFIDRTSLISKTTSTVTGNLMEGALIVIFVLVILLGNWRGGLIVASTIPLSLLFAFILMNVFDVWANLMSLGAIDFGIIVDGAVIIVESTVFMLVQQIKKLGKNTAQTRDEVAKEASAKMMNSAFFGQLIILIVFLPILFLEGVEGKMFKPMALTFMFAMVGAMILCLTYVPMVSAWFIRVPDKEKESLGDKIVHWLEDRYELLLAKALKRAVIIVCSALAFLALSVFVFTKMGGEFIPQLDEGDIAFHAALMPGSSLDETIKTTTKIEQLVIDNFPEVEQVLSRIGVAELPTDPMPMDIADVIVVLKPKEEWTSAETKGKLIEKMKDKLGKIPGVNYEFTQPIEMRFNELLTGVREDIAIKLYGEDLQVLADKAQEMSMIIATVDGVADMRVEATGGLPLMTIKYQRDKLAQYGLNIEEINSTVQAAFAGGKAGVLFEGERRFDIVVRLENGLRNNINDLKNLYIHTPNGSQIPLKEVAEISYEPGPMQISRDNTNRRTYVGINVRGRDVKSLVNEIKQKLEGQFDLPAGYYIRYGGAFENLERASKRLQVVVPLALVLIFILIFFALRSMKQTFMIYMAIPLATIGGIFALWLRGMPFSISAGVGFIVLFGVAVLNGLVLISGWNELKAEGITDLDERIHLGAKRRLRPILLTALTDVLGFLPMALSSSAGAEVQQPLATVVIGGLMTSSLLTLFVLPILYRWTEKSSSKKVKLTPAVAVALLLFAGMLYPTSSQAQEQVRVPISMEQALERAKVNYPQLQVAKLEVEKQSSLKKSAWDLGQTQVLTSGEEVDGVGNGVYTVLGIQQQNIDVFGISPNVKLQKQKVLLAEAAYHLSEAELEQQVKQAYAQAFVARNKLVLYASVDSIYLEFQRAAELRYEVEASSRLEYLAASNQTKQIALQKGQAAYDYAAALQKLNLWLVSDTVFEIDASDDDSWLGPIVVVDSVQSHPLLAIGQQNIEVANAQLKAANASFFPKLNGMYGSQKIGDVSGFYQYQLGLTIPLFFNKEQGWAQSAKIQQKIAEYQLMQTKFELNTAYQSMLLEYRKWEASWQFYQEEALPLAREQRQGAVVAFEEGAIDYVAFIQNMKEAVFVELGAQEALASYLAAKFKLDYYLTTGR